MSRANHIARTIVTLAALAVLGACGGEATPAGTELLRASLDGELPAEVRGRLGDATRGEPTEVSFPDGEGTVAVRVTHARTPEGGSFLHTIEVEAGDAAGYTLTAALVGNPTNQGSEAAPEHGRLVQVTRSRSGLTGTSTAQMSLRVTPGGAERL